MQLWHVEIGKPPLHLSRVTFTPMPVKRGNEPDFVVTNDDGAGGFEAGAAWAKTR
jgi:uncharacterized protein (DUF736 family)